MEFQLHPSVKTKPRTIRFVCTLRVQTKRVISGLALAIGWSWNSMVEDQYWLGMHFLVSLLSESLFGRLAGYDDVNDTDRLSLDPVTRQMLGGAGSGW